MLLFSIESWNFRKGAECKCHILLSGFWCVAGILSFTSEIVSDNVAVQSGCIVSIWVSLIHELLVSVQCTKIHLNALEYT